MNLLNHVSGLYHKLVTRCPKKVILPFQPMEPRMTYYQGKWVHSYVIDTENHPMVLLIEMDDFEQPKNFQIRRSIMGQYVTIVSSMDSYIYLSLEVDSTLGFTTLEAATLIMKQYNVNIIGYRLIWMTVTPKQKRKIQRKLGKLT